MVEIIPYVPTRRVKPERYLEGWPTSWHPNEEILADLFERFQVPLRDALEFGVEHGHSAIALSNFFKTVFAVDPWPQQITDQSRPMWEVVQENVRPYTNIALFRMTWQEFTKNRNRSQWDLVHIDGEHSYAETYNAAAWAAQHTDFILAHDTRNNWVEVTPALLAAAEEYGLKFYNFEENEGLGILTSLELKK